LNFEREQYGLESGPETQNTTTTICVKTIVDFLFLTTVWVITVVNYGFFFKKAALFYVLTQTCNSKNSSNPKQNLNPDRVPIQKVSSKLQITYMTK